MQEVLRRGRWLKVAAGDRVVSSVQVSNTPAGADWLTSIDCQVINAVLQMFSSV